jgi:hypothetical protein
MGISRAIKTAALAGLTSLALLIPAGSAHAVTLHEAPFCVWSWGSNSGITLKPGQTCRYFPLPTHGYYTWAKVIDPGSNSGRICAAITQYPGYQTYNALNDAGQVDPSAWTCYEMGGRYPAYAGQLLLWARFVNNGFGAVYGQATVLNFSTATIRFVDHINEDQNSVFVYY